MCAAWGKLPGQDRRHIIFARAPSSLDFVNSPRVDNCSGYSDIRCNKSGYATDSIFFLEVCFYSQICSNGHELFQLEVGQPWECNIDHAACIGLSRRLVEPPWWRE
jgi:hypothetical protein